MSGYRQSNFDPNAYQEAGAPIRPFNWVQWTGIALGGFGLVLTTANVAGQLGWIDPLIDGNPPTFLFLIFGVILFNSRRHPPTDVTPDERATRKRWLIVIAFVCAFILGLAAAIDLLGA